MYDSECARCKKCLDCKHGKENHNPCVCFEPRHPDKKSYHNPTDTMKGVHNE